MTTYRKLGENTPSIYNPLQNAPKKRDPRIMPKTKILTPNTGVGGTKIKTPTLTSGKKPIAKKR
jgi:hypothetical protein